MVVGENSNQTVTDETIFGALEKATCSPVASIAIREGFNLAVSLGVPRMFDQEWRFGA
jgi:hypothetical protein